MRIETWTSGYKVEACDWYDGKHIFSAFNISRPVQGYQARPRLNGQF